MKGSHFEINEPKNKNKWIYWVSIGVVLIFIYKFLDNFTNIGLWFGRFLKVLAPFLEAILIAYILYVPCARIEKRILKKKKIKHARQLSIAIVYIIVILIIVLMLEFIVPALIGSFADLISNIQNYYNSINNNEMDLSWAPFLKDLGPTIQTSILKPIVEYLQQIDFQSILTPAKIETYINSAVGAVKGLLNLFIAIICSIYLLSERASIIKFITKFSKSTMKEEKYYKFKKYFASGSQIFFGFLSSQLIDGCVVAIITSVAMTIMHVKYAILLGALIGLFNLIPFFGAIAAVIIAVLITILTGGWQQALIMAVVITILQQIDANIINPKITGTALEISPLLVVFSVTVGGAYFGVPGMFLAVPIATLIKLIVSDGVDDRIAKQRFAKKNNP